MQILPQMETNHYSEYLRWRIKNENGLIPNLRPGTERDFYTVIYKWGSQNLTILVLPELAGTISRRK